MSKRGSFWAKLVGVTGNPIATRQDSFGVLSCLVFLSLRFHACIASKDKKTRQKDMSLETSRLLRFKDETQDMSWKPPGLPASPRSKKAQKSQDKTKI